MIKIVLKDRFISRISPKEITKYKKDAKMSKPTNKKLIPNSDVQVVIDNGIQRAKKFNRRIASVTTNV